MVRKLQDIVSDEDVARVHGHADFGNSTPREVIAEGVIKTAQCYRMGSVMQRIVTEHKLIDARYGIPRLSDKGREYLARLLRIKLGH